MIKLLQFEAYKLVRQKSLYICFGISAVLLFLSNLLMKYVILTEGVSDSVVLSEYFKSRMISVLDVSDFTMIFGIFVSLLVCSDFAMETVKNIYSRGFSKSQVFAVKLAIVVVVLTIEFIVLHLVGAIVGAVLFKFAALDGNHYLVIFSNYLVSLCWATFAFGLGYSFRRVGPTIAGFIIVPVIVTLLISLADQLLNWESFKFSDYWFQNFEMMLAGRALYEGELNQKLVTISFS